MRHEAWSSFTILIASTLQPRALIALALLSAVPGWSRRNAEHRIRWSLLTLCAFTLSCASTLHSVSRRLPQVDGFTFPLAMVAQGYLATNMHPRQRWHSNS